MKGVGSGIDRKWEMMSYQEFEEIERIHSCWSMMNKVARMAYLKGEKNQLCDMAYRYGLYLRSKGGLITDEERMKGMHLIEMIDAVQAEGEKVNADYRNEWWNEWRKQVSSEMF